MRDSVSRFRLTRHQPQINHFIRVNNTVPLTEKCFRIEGSLVGVNEQIRIFVINSVMACMVMDVLLKLQDYLFIAVSIG